MSSASQGAVGLVAFDDLEKPIYFQERPARPTERMPESLKILTWQCALASEYSTSPVRRRM